MSEHQIQEKSILEIWSKTLPRLPRNRFNSFASLSGILIGALPLAIGPFSNFSSTYQPLNDLLVATYASLLGFVIAGYAIFTSSSNPVFSLELWKFVESKSKMPLLKVHLLVFIRLFIVVFIALFILLGLSLFFRIRQSTLPHLSMSNSFRALLQGVTIAFMGWSITAVAVQLKILIFNLYDLTLTQARFLEIQSRKAAEKLPSEKT